MTELDIIKLALECLLKTTASHKHIKILHNIKESEFEEFMEKRENYIQSTIKLLNESIEKE